MIHLFSFRFVFAQKHIRQTALIPHRDVIHLFGLRSRFVLDFSVAAVLAVVVVVVFPRFFVGFSFVRFVDFPANLNWTGFDAICQTTSDWKEWKTNEKQRKNRTICQNQQRSQLEWCIILRNLNVIDSMRRCDDELVTMSLRRRPLTNTSIESRHHLNVLTHAMRRANFHFERIKAFQKSD